MGGICSRWREKEKISKFRNRSKTRLKIRKIRILTLASLLLKISTQKFHIRHLLTDGHNSSVSTFALSLIVSPLGGENLFVSQFFDRKFVSQQPEVVESRVIAHLDGFLIANTINEKISKVGQRSKTRSNIQKSH